MKKADTVCVWGWGFHSEVKNGKILFLMKKTNRKQKMGEWVVNRKINRVVGVVKKQPVLFASAICAVISACFVPPSLGYLAYIDWNVLMLLFSLMAVIAGLNKGGLFLLLSRRLLSGERNFRGVSLILVLLPFFLSMLVTNDVALIALVPFTILVLSLVGQNKSLIYIIVLQTVGANLGSMLTPSGNPQNLYLYSRYQIPTGDFFGVTLPVVLAALILLSIAALFVPRSLVQVQFDEPDVPKSKRGLVLFGILFLLCLSGVFRVIPVWIVFLVCLGTVLIYDRSLLRNVDFGLLSTFICFFVFAGNLGNIPAVQRGLAMLMEGYACLTATAASQVMSNVPAAIVLSAFTEDWRALLLGTNIGGLGTMIASLASLISFQFYLKTPRAKPLRYLIIFTAVNLGGLICLLLFSKFVGLW